MGMYQLELIRHGILLVLKGLQRLIDAERSLQRGNSYKEQVAYNSLRVSGRVSRTVILVSSALQDSSITVQTASN